MPISSISGKRKDSSFFTPKTKQPQKKKKKEDEIEKIGLEALKKVTSNQSTKDESDKLNLLDLPDELLIKVIGYCNNRDQASIACSCKSLNRIVNDQAFQTKKTAKLIGLRKVNNSWITSYRELEEELESIKDYIDASTMSIETKNEVLVYLIAAYSNANKIEMAKKLTEQIQNNNYLFLSTKLIVLAHDYKFNTKENIDEINSLVHEVESIIDLMDISLKKNNAYLNLLKIHLFIDQIQRAKLLIDKIENKTNKFQAHLEIFKKCKNENEKENIKTFIDQLDSSLLKIIFSLNFLKACQEIDLDYDIAIEKDTILSFIENLPNTLIILKTAILLEFINTYLDDIEAKQKTELYINQLEEGYHSTANFQLKLALSYIQIGKNSKAKSIINQITKAFVKFSAIIEFLKKNPSDFQTKKQAKLIIDDEIETPDLKAMALIKFLTIYPEDIEAKKQIKLFTDQIEDPFSKIKVLSYFIKTYYFDS